MDQNRFISGANITEKYTKRQMFFYAVPEEVVPLSGFGNVMTQDLQRQSLENQSPKALDHTSEMDEDEQSSRLLDAIN